MNIKSRSGMEGFTLIEMMIVVTIIAILAAVAWTNYQNYVIETRWSEAKSFLEQVMHQEEKYYTENLTYSTALDTDLGFSSGTPKSENSHYQVSASACGSGVATCVQLTATPISATQLKDGRCKKFTLNSQGQKGVSGGSDGVDKCW